MKKHLVTAVGLPALAFVLWWSVVYSMPGEVKSVSLLAAAPSEEMTAPWAMFHHDPQHTGRSPYAGPQENTVSWVYRAGSPVYSSPAVGPDGTIYVGSENSKLYALAPDGSLIWAFHTGGGIYSSPAIAADGTIYVGSRDHNLYAINPDGTLYWSYPTGGEVNSSPTVGSDGTIYVGSNDGTLYAITPAGGLGCSYPAGAVIDSSPAIGPDGTIYVGSSNGRMHAVYPDCTVKWSEVVSGNGVWTHPALSPDGGTLYFGGDDGYLYATETLSGTLKWKSPWTYGGVQSSAAVGSDGTVYVGTQYGNLWALDPADGSLEWDHYTTLAARSSPAIGADGTIYFASDYGYVFALNPDGTSKWTYEGGHDVAGHFRSSPAIGANGALYIGSTNGKIFAFDALPASCGPQIGEWQSAMALPMPSATTGGRGQQLVIHDGRAYVFGGANGVDSRLTGVYYSSIDDDGSLGPWLETTPLPGQYFDQVVVHVGRFFYLITGGDGAVAVFYAPINADGTLGAWTRTVDLQPSRQEFAAATSGEYIYVVAGNATGLSNLVKFTSVNPDGSLNAWADTTPLPEAMQYHTAVAYEGSLYVFAPNTNVYAATIQADGSLGNWSTSMPLPQEMVGYATFDLRDHVYLVGGGPSQAVSYSPVLADGALGPWQSTVALPAQRSRLRAGGYNCFVYALGGYDGSLYQDTVYYARLQAPCEPVSSLQLSRAPSGSLFAGVTVQFMANAGGTVPFTYTWTLDGAPVGENLSTFHHTFATSGTYSVGVTVENACGQAEETMIVEVQGLAPGQPDLSPSRKVVNLSSVEIGDVLTYTILLHNDSATVATANLTDLVPLHTTYLPGTARASDGGSVTLTGGELQWSGQVISGIPVLVSFAVEVQAVPLGTQITNTAYLDDGLGNVLLLTADSLYNPGFGLSIDDGALYTNIPTVTLHYTWDAADDITHVKLSNDGGFGPEGNTTDWLPVDPDNPTYIDWVLATYSQLTLPRTVYAKFRDLSGKQYGPVQDDIIYDPDLPLVKVVEIIPQETRGAAPRQGQNVIVRVTASDPNSGVAKIQLSHDYAFGQFSEYASAGPTTDIAWTLQLSGLVYVRVVDRAGNVSDVVSEQGTTRIYLPAVMRGLTGH